MNNSFFESYMKRNMDDRLRSRRNKKRSHAVVSRTFLNSPDTSELLHIDDVILVMIPEDMLIHGCVDPNLHFRVGKIKKINDGLSEDVTVALKARKLEADQKESKKSNNRKEIVTLPKFCLCLEQDVYNERSHRRQKENIKACRQLLEPMKNIPSPTFVQ
ncbi:reticulocyte-binding protein [Acrasis kona]|uniref:Reticulocyte-binding protein n=1 Tax=Acrasis kona TaxID=1008807 RepID=A0AAW2ZHZ6_9EUKA